MTKKYPFEFSKGEDLFYVALDVADYDRAKKFYQDIFNFEITFDAGNYNENNVIKPGSTTLGINVEDIDETKKYLDSKSVYTSEIRDQPDLISIFDMKDSEGNIIQFIGKPRITSKK